MQNFMELDMKQFSDLKTLTFVVSGLKTSLGQFGPKVLWQRSYQAISPEPLLQFSHTESHFLKNHKANPTKS